VVSSGITVSFTFFPSVPEPGEEVRFFVAQLASRFSGNGPSTVGLAAKGHDMTTKFPSAGAYSVSVIVTDASGSAMSLTNRVEFVLARLPQHQRSEGSLSDSECSSPVKLPAKPRRICGTSVMDFISRTQSAHRFQLAGSASSPKAFTVRLKVTGASGQAAQAQFAVSIVPLKKEAAPRAALQPQGGLTHKTGAPIQFLMNHKGRSNGCSGRSTAKAKQIP